MTEGLAERLRRLAGEIEAALVAARAEEREACAQIAEHDGKVKVRVTRGYQEQAKTLSSEIRLAIAAAIRARGAA